MRVRMSYDVTNQDDIQVERLLMKASLLTINHEKKVGKSDGSFMTLSLCTNTAYTRSFYKNNFHKNKGSNSQKIEAKN